MSREFKFRAWDKEDNKMWKVVSITESVWGDCEEAHIRVCEIHENQSKKETDVRMSVDYELMQYTGLKDKNGKEIYEGDILELYIPNWADCDDVQRFVINEYCPDVSYLQAVVKHCEECLLDGENDYIEVVGNIYENPELLEVTA